MISFSTAIINNIALANVNAPERPSRQDEKLVTLFKGASGVNCAPPGNFSFPKTIRRTAGKHCSAYIKDCENRYDTATMSLKNGDNTGAISRQAGKRIAANMQLRQDTPHVTFALNK